MCASNMASRQDLDKAKVALKKLVAMTGHTEGSKEQASHALRQLFRSNGLAPKSGDHPEMDAKLATLLDRVLKHGTAGTAKLEAPAPAMESPVELAEKMGDEVVKQPLPEIPKRRLVLPQEGGLAAPMKVRVKEARKALQAKDAMVTQLTHKLKLCRKEVWALQCETNAADVKVGRILLQREAELPERFRQQLAELKVKEEALADQLSEARANAQRWASVAKRQDAMLQQEREERSDVQSILAKHPAGVVFFSPGADSDSEEETGKRRNATEVTLGSSDEDSYRPPRTGAAAKARAHSDDSSESSGSADSLDLPGTGATGTTERPALEPSAAVGAVLGKYRSVTYGKQRGVTLGTAKAKAVPPLPTLQTRKLEEADEVYSDISEDIPESLLRLVRG
ncbi:unnamed protein product [Effrenium voratum]|nr:unnamed protein product [Effrenium voratum]